MEYIYGRNFRIVVVVCEFMVVLCGIFFGGFMLEFFGCKEGLVVGYFLMKCVVISFVNVFFIFFIIFVFVDYGI